MGVCRVAKSRARTNVCPSLWCHRRMQKWVGTFGRIGNPQWVRSRKSGKNDSIRSGVWRKEIDVSRARRPISHPLWSRSASDEWSHRNSRTCLRASMAAWFLRRSRTKNLRASILLRSSRNAVLTQRCKPWWSWRCERSVSQVRWDCVPTESVTSCERWRSVKKSIAQQLAESHIRPMTSPSMKTTGKTKV